jgi:hypothetical protein
MVMNKLIKGLFLISLLFFVRCNKKPDLIICTVIDPFYGKPIAGARVALIETKESIFGLLEECKTMAEFTTDENGKVFFERIKLSNKGSRSYWLRLKSAYNETLTNANDCVIISRDLEVPKSANSLELQMVYVPGYQTGWVIKVTNLNPTGTTPVNKDSLSVRIVNDFDFIDGWGGSNGVSTQNGSKKLVGEYTSSVHKFTNTPNTVKYPGDAFYPITYGKQKVLVHKRKNGITSDTSYIEIVSHKEEIHEFIVEW